MSGVLQIKRGVVGSGGLNDGEFYLNKGINAVQIGSGSSILTLLPLNQTVTGDIILNGNIYANNLNISSSYALSSSYAQYAATASYIISSSTSQTSISSSYAATASFVLSSNVYGPWGFNSIVTASYAVTSSYAIGYLQTSLTQSMLNPYLLISNTGSMLQSYVLNSQTSSFLTTADLSNYVTNTQTSSFVTNSQTGSFVTNSQTGSFVTNNQTSSFVTNSQTGSFVTNNQTGSFVTNNQTGSFVTNNQTGSFILNSQTSSMTVATASYVSSSNVYGPNGFDSILTASYAATSSWAIGIVGGAQSISSSYPFAVSGSTIYSFNSNKIGSSIYNVPTNQNILIGESAAADSVISASIVIGYQTATYADKTKDVVIIGNTAGQSLANVTASNFIGYYAGINSNASYTNLIGYYAGGNAYNASNSNFIGYNSGRGAYSASYSTLIGYQTGYRTGVGSVGIGSNNIIIGTNITLDDRRTDSINIGGIIFGTGSYSTITGRPYSGSAAGRIGINVPIPTYNLHVSGTVAFPSLQQSSSAYIVMYDSSSGQLFYTASSAISGSGGGSGTPAPSDTYIQYNQGGSFGGDSSFRYIYESHSLQQGYYTTASGDYSHAEGRNTIAATSGSHTEGYLTSAGAISAFSASLYNFTTPGVGKYLEIDTNGIGSIVSSYYYNYITIDDLGYLGYGIINLPVSQSLWNGSKVIVWISESSAGGLNWPDNTLAIAGNYTIPLISNAPYYISYGNYNHAEGYHTIATGYYSHAEGYESRAIGGYSHAEGDNTQAIGIGSHAEGYSTIAYGDASHAEGANTQAIGTYSHAEGYSTRVIGNYSHAEGLATSASGDYQHVIGKYNLPNTSSLYIIGNGSYGNRSNLALFNSESIILSKSIYLPDLTSSSEITNVVLYDSASGQLFYTASSAIGGASLTGGADGYVSLWTGSTALTTSSIYQSGSSIGINTTNPSASLHIEGNFYQIGQQGYIFNPPYVDVNNLYDWSGYNDVFSGTYGLINDLGISIFSSTTSSLVITGDIEFGGAYPLPHTWSIIQIADNNTHTYLNINDPYYSDISSITFYSQSFDGTYYTVFYSSSISPGTVLPNTIYTSVGIDYGSFIVSSSIYFPVLQPSPTINSNFVSFDKTNGQLFYSENTLNGQNNYIPLWTGSSQITSSVLYQNNKKIGLGTTTPQATFDVSGSTIITKENSTALTVVGSGSATPVFVVYGSQGELFSVTDSLSGSLFSVHDISGLPVIESFSDATTLIGNYEAPALYTSVKKTINTGIGQVIYQVPTASYDGIFYDYTVASGSNARSGQVIVRHLSGSVNLAEIATPDFGDTSGFELGVIVTGSYMALTGSASTSGWVLKTIVRSI